MAHPYNPDGKTHHPLYKTWCNMLSRCYCPTDRRYDDYGGRGVTVCREWRDDFYQFVADMGQRPVAHSIERSDNDGNYCASNCVWATRSQQDRNRRSNTRITCNGVTKLHVEWAESLGLSRSAFAERVKRHGFLGAIGMGHKRVRELRRDPDECKPPTSSN